MNKQTNIIIVLLLLSGTCFAQLTDLARIEYTYFPQEQSDNSFRRFRTFINVPIKLKEDTYLVPGFEYRNVNLKFEDVVPFSREDLDRFQSFSLSLGYTQKISEEWRIGAKLGTTVTSNFSTGSATSNDYVHTGALYFINDKTNEGLDKPWRLIVGGRYDTESGRPFPLPFINYYKEFHPDWSYTLGVPKSNIKRYFGKDRRHILQSFVTLDGFYANIQDNVDVAIPAGEFETAESISMTVALFGVGYEYCFTKHLVFYIYAGHTIINDIRLRDGDRDDVFTINDRNTFYGRSGIKFKI
ncbi:DUF6268 family outer membrane beta-barrel protein [Dokdonia sp. Asnod3-C12]|jgi:hypothetical protein|uniref:DUF6268 family outer membrane beta-barrel protein n=1 Tax=Dokdonia sp. Asnod3-C12 TaxID=3160575 RepID=UPI0030EF3A6E|tara:strand:+ start:12377 stop:13273 length:897 start_codon:yes stop_codon:yes gene_type:complete